MKALLRFVALLAALALVLLPLRERDVRPVIVADEYARIVNNVFIARNWLRMTKPESPDAAASGQDLPPIPRIEFFPDSAGPLAPAAELFASRSYLKADIDRFNAPLSDGDAVLFDYSRNGLDAIDVRAHRFRLPYNHSRVWTGSLRLRSPSDTQPLVSLRSTETAPRRISVMPQTIVNVVRNKEPEIELFAPAPPGPVVAQDIGDSISLLHCGKKIARLWRIGDELVLRPFEKASENKVNVGINGRRIGLDDVSHVYHLPADAVLYFAKQPDAAPCPAAQLASVAYIRDVSDAAIVYNGASKVWQQQWQQPFYENLVAILDAAAARGNADIVDDVTLTLSPSLEFQSRAILRGLFQRYADAKPRDAAKFKLDKPRYAFALMDGVNGELLALPSFPERSDAPARTDSSRPDPWLNNHNFSRLAAGSIAKILFAAPILDTHPEWLNLRIPGNYCEPDPRGGNRCFISSVLGIPLGDDGGIYDQGVGLTDIGFTAAIAKSVNKYALTLLTLASRHPDAAGASQRAITRPADRFSLVPGKRSYDAIRPDGLLFEPGADFRVEEVQKLPWVQRIIELYGVYAGDETPVANRQRPDSGASATSLQRDRDTEPPRARRYIWRGLPGAFKDAFRNGGAYLLDVVSPEYEELHLDGVDQQGEFSSDYLPLILGGAESRWSTIELAEAMATLMSNKPVAATLVSGKEDGSVLAESRRGPWKKLKREVHVALANATQSVVFDGTADALAPLVRRLRRQAAQQDPPLTFALFAKTGTPELLRRQPSPAADIFGRMAAEGIFTRDPESGAIRYRGEIPRLGDLPSFSRARSLAPYSSDFPRYFARNVNGRCGEFSAETLWREVFKTTVATYNSLDPADRPGRSLVTPHGALAALQTCEIVGERFGAGIVFYAALYEAAAEIPLDANGNSWRIDVAGHSPKKAVSVAIAFEDGGMREFNRHIHTDAAAQLLCGPVAEHLGLKRGCAP